MERQSLASKKDIWTKIGFVDGYGTTNEPMNYSFQDRKLNTGKYNYRLKQIDYNNRSVEHFLSDVVAVGVPKKYDLSQNYPNPFNPTTMIEYTLPTEGWVSLHVYDITGRLIRTLINNEYLTADYYTVVFNGSNLASGVYFYRLVTEENIATKKMLLIK